MKKLPKFISKEEFERVLSYVMRKKPKNYKSYALSMILAFEAGLRVSEIVGFKDKVPPLTKDKIDMEQHTIRIESGKGQKDRIVPLPKKVTQNAITLLPIKLSRRSLQDFVTRMGKDVINKEITFHSLRHGFGSHLAASGRPIHEIQMLMGHSRMDTTGIYLHANPKTAVEGARELF